ncbi:helix-turn-helix transcriptional regulator [Candidatus Methylocalor cossyra]|uniref:Transcriptional regulator n=1 Tax=Candidatus Methylocalor cossyra TaxID=3108543 RepID=A0ABM9NKB9_9GAMM
MNFCERLYELHKILSTHRLPVSRQALQERLQCSPATLSRLIRHLRDRYGAPIEHDREGNGYRYRRDGNQPIDLPGLWFTPAELRALLVLHQLLTQSHPRLLDTLLAPLRMRLERLIRHPYLGGQELSRRVRILSQGHREPDAAIFEHTAAALLDRKRLEIRYHARGEPRITERCLSPQRLVFYRDNWYLDAWCHTREALRTFALERMQAARLTEESALDVPEPELDRHYASSYGIFAGPPRHTAVLRFTPERARWVAEELWFPGQDGEFLEDGSYRLRLPYADARELILDILRYGPDVVVESPLELRRAVAERLRNAWYHYRDEACG